MNKNNGWPTYIDAISLLTRLGASQVIQPELEGGREWIRQVLPGLAYPLRQVYQYASAFRTDQYNFEFTTKAEHRCLQDLNRALKGMKIIWWDLAQDTLLEGNIRLHSDALAAVVVFIHQLIPTPGR